MDHKDSKLSLILTIGSLIGLTTTTLLAMNSGAKLQTIFDEFPEDETRKNKIKKLTPVIAPTVASFALTAGSIAYTYIYGEKVYQNVLSASIATKALYDTYRKKNIELNGEEADISVIEEIAEERAKEDTKLLPEEESLYYEPVLDNYFTGTREILFDIERQINKCIQLDGFASMLDVYEHIPTIAMKGDALQYGWSFEDLFSGYLGDGWVYVDYVTVKNDPVHGTYRRLVYSVDPWEDWYNQEYHDVSLEELYSDKL